ncbi:MAG: hypothetical protein FJW90_01380 [Actinobacteria bacterium]|nr:hypothetical protein [Actinomycetota bacterium]
MNRRRKFLTVFIAALSACLIVSAVGVGKSKIKRVGTSAQVETSAHGKRNIVVTGVLQSSLPRCERQRSVLLYWLAPNDDFQGAALGHAVSKGGSARGQFEIIGEAPKKIKNSRRFRVEAVGRKVKVKGKEVICKRGVSVAFPGTFD